MCLCGALAACGSSEDLSLEVVPPLRSARVSSYTGWFPGPWHQEISIELEPGVAHSQVADLRVFGALRPGMTLDQAESVEGEPDGESVDRRGTRWKTWRNDFGEAQVGCVESCSSSNCASVWRLRAFPGERAYSSVFNPPISTIVAQAVAQRPTVEYRSVSVDTYKHESKLSLVMESKSEEYLWWATESPECEP